MTAETDDNAVRCFIAVEISVEQQRELSQKCLNWRQRYDGLRWGKVENYHLTLAFLGKQSKAVLIELSQRLHHVLDDMAPIILRIDQLEFFPARRPHVVAARIRPSSSLTTLYQCINAVCRECGIDQPQPGRSFHPHITVARFRPQSFGHKPSPLTLDLTVSSDSVALFSSELSRDGAIHRVMERFVLQRG
nr:RNA 2',3'-cyclic phosphodiesterase [uncultured Desulfuromonas sp.]